MRLAEATAIRIYAVLQQKNLTPHDFGKYCQFPEKKLNSILNGQFRDLSVRDLHRICSALDISYDAFFNDSIFQSEIVD